MGDLFIKQIEYCSGALTTSHLLAHAIALCLHATAGFSSMGAPFLANNYFRQQWHFLLSTTLLRRSPLVVPYPVSFPHLVCTSCTR